jgi:hypothetical protein
MALMANAADFMCHMSAIGKSGNKQADKDSQIFEGLNLSYGAMGVLTEELKAERAQVDTFLEALS